MRNRKKAIEFRTSKVLSTGASVKPSLKSVPKRTKRVTTIMMSSTLILIDQ